MPKSNLDETNWALAFAGMLLLLAALFPLRIKPAAK